jgi:hypothetical protein
MHVVSFGPSPTAMASREHQRGASRAPWWVGTVRFCVQKGLVEYFRAKSWPRFSHHSTPPRLRTGKSMHVVSFWPSPTAMASREHQRWCQINGASLYILHCGKLPLLHTEPDRSDLPPHLRCPSLRSRLAMMVSEGQKRTRSIESPVRRQIGVK